MSGNVPDDFRLEHVLLTLRVWQGREEKVVGAVKGIPSTLEDSIIFVAEFENELWDRAKRQLRRGLKRSTVMSLIDLKPRRLEVYRTWSGNQLPHEVLVAKTRDFCVWLQAVLEDSAHQSPLGR